MRLVVIRWIVRKPSAANVNIVLTVNASSTSGASIHKEREFLQTVLVKTDCKFCGRKKTARTAHPRFSEWLQHSLQPDHPAHHNKTSMTYMMAWTNQRYAKNIFRVNNRKKNMHLVRYIDTTSFVTMYFLTIYEQKNNNSDFLRNEEINGHTKNMRVTLQLPYILEQIASLNPYFFWPFENINCMFIPVRSWIWHLSHCVYCSCLWTNDIKLCLIFLLLLFFTGFW